MNLVHGALLTLTAVLLVIDTANARYRYHATRRGEGPGIGPVLGPRHEELGDGVELRAHRVPSQVRACI